MIKRVIRNKNPECKNSFSIFYCLHLYPYFLCGLEVGDVTGEEGGAPHNGGDVPWQVHLQLALWGAAHVQILPGATGLVYSCKAMSQ